MQKEGGSKILYIRKRQTSLQGVGKYAIRKSEVSWGERSNRQNQPQREGMNENAAGPQRCSEMKAMCWMMEILCSISNQESVEWGTSLSIIFLCEGVVNISYYFTVIKKQIACSKALLQWLHGAGADKQNLKKEFKISKSFALWIRCSMRAGTLSLVSNPSPQLLGHLTKLCEDNYVFTRKDRKILGKCLKGFRFRAGSFLLSNCPIFFQVYC